MPSENHKRKAAEQGTETQRGEVRDTRAPNECKEDERSKDQATKKKEAKATYREDEYLTDEQIEAFIASLGQKWSEEIKMEGQGWKND